MSAVYARAILKRMRSSPLPVVSCVLTLAATCLPVHGFSDSSPLPETCAARRGTDGAVSVTWHVSAPDDLRELDRWCRAVGPPVLVPIPRAGGTEVPEPDDLVVVTWNAHLSEGRLDELIDDLRAGRLTGGNPVRHFVLLLQELYRRGPDVPPFAPGNRSAFAIADSGGNGRDVHQHANTLGLSMLYVPSMRNGAGAFEDRGNAIVSTEPLQAPFAVELPLERQRRVAVGASIVVRTAAGPADLDVVSAHLESLSSPALLWFFKSPRPRQVVALLRTLESRRPSGVQGAGKVIGGDFNTIQAGADEDAYSIARAWSRNLSNEDPRRTHRMGRLDYLFFRLREGWTATTSRVDERYGSDHHPVLGRLVTGAALP